jgi:small subunit ribosomal protein S16
MLVVRLKPNGRIKRISYRIVVMEKRSTRNGKAIADLGYYNPNQISKSLEYDKKALNDWVQKGAQVSPAVEKLIK